MSIKIQTQNSEYELALGERGLLLRKTQALRPTPLDFPCEDQGGTVRFDDGRIHLRGEKYRVVTSLVQSFCGSMSVVTLNSVYTISATNEGFVVAKEKDRLDMRYQPPEVILRSIRPGEQSFGDQISFAGIGSSLELWSGGQKIFWTSDVVSVA